MGTDMCKCILMVTLYSAAPLENQAANTMTHPTQSHFPDTEPTSHIEIMLSAWLGSDKYQFLSY